jgi:quercetin dioxygenase-like cupin family protein
MEELSMGDQLTMPDGSMFEIVRSPVDPERDPSEIAFTVLPHGPAPPPHIHPRQREVFTLHEGDFELLLDGSWRKVQPGESVVVEPGQQHTYRNHGSATARVTTVHEPGLDFQTYIRRLQATAVAQGSTRITPGLAVRMAVLYREHSDTIAPGSAPLKVAFGVLGRIGPLVGLRPEKGSLS